VEALSDQWEKIYGVDEAARMRSEEPQPLDNFLHDRFVLVRQIVGSIVLRLGRNLPGDQTVLVDRSKIDKAVRSLTEGRGLLAEAVGVERMGELERESLGVSPADLAPADFAPDVGAPVDLSQPAVGTSPTERIIRAAEDLRSFGVAHLDAAPSDLTASEVRRLGDVADALEAIVSRLEGDEQGGS
jgi:hypothetical protein